MSRRAGQLLWHRMKILVPAFDVTPGTLDVDTGISETLRGENVNGPNQPKFDTVLATPAVSRLNVIPQSPFDAWFAGAILHGEPYLDPGTNTLHVIFTNNNVETPAAVSIDVLFWDPHSLCGPGLADSYLTHGGSTPVRQGGAKDGNLLWSRFRLTLAAGAGAGNLIDTGIEQTNRSFASDSAGAPALGGEPVMPEVGVSEISRLQVIPMCSSGGLAAWLGVTHGEPFATVNIDGRTTLKVQFTNANGGPVTVNVLFWDPHTAIGPGEANAYNPDRG